MIALLTGKGGVVFATGNNQSSCSSAGPLSNFLMIFYQFIQHLVSNHLFLIFHCQIVVSLFSSCLNVLSKCLYSFYSYLKIEWLSSCLMVVSLSQFTWCLVQLTSCIVVPILVQQWKASFVLKHSAPTSGYNFLLATSGYNFSHTFTLTPSLRFPKKIRLLQSSGQRTKKPTTLPNVPLHGYEKY